MIYLTTGTRTYSPMWSDVARIANIFPPVDRCNLYTWRDQRVVLFQILPIDRLALLFPRWSTSIGWQLWLCRVKLAVATLMSQLPLWMGVHVLPCSFCLYIRWVAIHFRRYFSSVKFSWILWNRSSGSHHCYSHRGVSNHDLRNTTIIWSLYDTKAETTVYIAALSCSEYLQVTLKLRRLMLTRAGISRVSNDLHLTLFFVLMLHGIVRKKYFYSSLLFSISVSYKMNALFFGPSLLFTYLLAMPLRE